MKDAELPRVMRVPRQARGAHYYIDRHGIFLFPIKGTVFVRLTKRQLERIVEILYDYVP